MDRYFKIIANENGCNEEIILKESNLLYAATEVNMNADFITKIIECDERGKEFDAGENTLPIQRVSQQRELLLSFAKHIEKAGYNGSCLTYEQELDEFLKANNSC